MESIYIIVLWMIGLILVGVGWYVPHYGGVAWLGAVTLLFGAGIAFLRRSS